jgi:hypothetical protein
MPDSALAPGMTQNKLISMLSALAAFAIIAAITFNVSGLNRGGPPIVLADER